MSQKRSSPTGCEMTISEAAWLASQTGLMAVAEAAELPDDILAASKALRKSYSPRESQLILLQRELRAKATAKFSRAREMLFSRRAYEQSTDEWIANYKAKRWQGCTLVADLCCGLGGDAMGMTATARRVICVDRDEALLQLARHNVQLISSNHEFIVDDVSAAQLANCEAWHIDPDRRSGDTRTVHPDFYEPSAAMIDQLLTVCPRGSVKLAPAASPPNHWRESAHLEWISRGRECRQLVAWFGETDFQPGTRSATNVTQLGTSHTFIGAGGQPFLFAEQLGHYLYEPDPAVLAADLTGEIAEQNDLRALTDGVHYLTGERALNVPLLTGYQVHEVFPLRLETVQSALQALGGGRVEVKKRGVDIDPSHWQAALDEPGEKSWVVIGTRLRDRMIAILAQRF